MACEGKGGCNLGGGVGEGWVVFCNLPSGGLLDVATTTTPSSNKAVKSLFKIMASAISVTCNLHKTRS